MIKIDIQTKKALKRASNINGILLVIFYAAELFIRDIAGPAIIKIRGEEGTEIILKYIFYIFLYLIVFPVLVLLNGKLTSSDTQEKLGSYICKPQKPASWVIKWFTVSFGMTTLSAYISNFAMLIFETLTGKEINRLISYSDGTAADIIISAAAMMILAPVFEELFFRGTVFRNIKDKGGYVMMIIAGITFGLWHTNTEQFLYASVMGFFSCFMFSRTHSILPSFFLHFILNTIGAVQYTFVTEEYFEKMQAVDTSYLMKNPGPMLLMLGIAFIYISFSIAAVIILIIHSCTDHPKNEAVPDTEKSRTSPASYAAAYISSPAMAAAVIIMITLTVINAMA